MSNFLKLNFNSVGNGGGSAGGVGTGSVGSNGKPNAVATSFANARPGGVAFGHSLAISLNLPVLGIKQTFGQGNGIVFRK